MYNGVKNLILESAYEEREGLVMEGASFVEIAFENGYDDISIDDAIFEAEMMKERLAHFRDVHYLQEVTLSFGSAVKYITTGRFSPEKEFEKLKSKIKTQKDKDDALQMIKDIKKIDVYNMTKKRDSGTLTLQDFKDTFKRNKYGAKGIIPAAIPTINIAYVIYQYISLSINNSKNQRNHKAYKIYEKELDNLAKDIKAIKVSK